MATSTMLTLNALWLRKNRRYKMKRILTYKNGLIHHEDNLIGQPLPKIVETLEISDGMTFSVEITPIETKESGWLFKYSPNFDTYRVVSEEGKYYGSICAKVFIKLFFEPIDKQMYSIRGTMITI